MATKKPSQLTEQLAAADDDVLVIENALDGTVNKIKKVNIIPVVPTKTSDLTNDSGFVTGGDVVPYTGADKEVDLGGNQLVTDIVVGHHIFDPNVIPTPLTIHGAINYGGDQFTPSTGGDLDLRAGTGSALMFGGGGGSGKVSIGDASHVAKLNVDDITGIQTYTFPDGGGTFATDATVPNYETDPVYTAWDKSTGISITESQISDFGSYEPANANIQGHISDTNNPHSTNVANLTDVALNSPHADDRLVFNGTVWENRAITTVSAGAGVDLYPNGTNSDIPTYDELLYVPTGGTEVGETVSVTSAGGQALIDSYITPALGRTNIDAGTWEFNTFRKVSSASGITTMTIKVYQRATGGTETLLFEVTGTEINDTVTSLSAILTVQSAFTILDTDRLVVKYYAQTDSSSARIVTFYHNGTEHYSHIHTPLTTLHNDLAGLQGGIAGEKYHVNSATATLLVTPSTTGNVLTSNGTIWTSATPAGGGQSPYDAIVAATGGDYTTLGAAVTAGKVNIFVKDGTYTETGNIYASVATNVTGQSHRAIIDLTTYYFGVGIANSVINGLRFNMTTGKLLMDGIGCKLLNCYIYKTGTGTIFEGSTSRQLLQGNYFAGTTAAAGGQVLLPLDSTFTGNIVYLQTSGNQNAFSSSWTNCIVTSNLFYCTTNYSQQILNVGSYTTVSDNVFHSTTTTNNIYGVYLQGSNITISGNTFNAMDVSIYATGGNYNSITGNTSTTNATGHFLLGAQTYLTVSGNTLFSNNTSSIMLRLASGTYGAITGNTFKGGTYAISMNSSANKYHTITGNTISGSTTAIVDDGAANIIKNNIGVAKTLEKEHVLMTNNSGSTIAAGAIVTYASVAAGNEITTTTAAGDSKAFGVAAEAINNAAAGYIQTLGKTTLLKVNGTTDIAIGDFISCYTEAGIGQKAATGHTAIAIALEAYTTDDSNGVIDALIISPRTV